MCVCVCIRIINTVCLNYKLGEDCFLQFHGEIGRAPGGVCGERERGGQALYEPCSGTMTLAPWRRATTPWDPRLQEVMEQSFGAQFLATQAVSISLVGLPC